MQTHDLYVRTQSYISLCQEDVFSVAQPSQGDVTPITQCQNSLAQVLGCRHSVRNKEDASRSILMLPAADSADWGGKKRRLWKRSRIEGRLGMRCALLKAEGRKLWVCVPPSKPSAAGDQ